MYPAAPPTLLHHLLITPNVPPIDHTLPRLRDQGLTLIGAGTVTTAWTLSMAVYHLPASPNKLSKP